MLLTGKKNFLKTADIKGGEVITFVNEGEWITSKVYKYDDGTPRQDFYIKVMIEGEERDLRLNVTNRTILVEAFGKETAEWVNRGATVAKEKVMVGGKRMDTIVLTPITEEEPAL